MKNALPFAVVFCLIAAILNGYVAIAYGMNLNAAAAILCLIGAGAAGWGWNQSKK